MNFDLGSAIAGKLPPKHKTLGPHGEVVDLESAIKLLGPLPDLRKGLPEGGDLYCSRQVMPALLWTIAQGFNEALVQDKAVGTWSDHQRRHGDIHKHSMALIKALGRLQPWEKKALVMDVDALARTLTQVRDGAKASTKESTIANTPHRFMHGSPKLRLAFSLLQLWRRAPKAPKECREGAFREFVELVARFATGEDTPMDRAIGDAMKVKDGRHPRPLYGDSPHMGLGWDEAFGQKAP